jgi:succinate dehydrogenase / fumarate reductase flavoprotein subunit
LLKELKEEFWTDLIIPDNLNDVNQELEKAGRVADYFEIADLMVDDALNRTESCGAHYREESQTPEGEALRDDKNFSYVAAWEYSGESKPYKLHKEELKFEYVEVKERSYK